MSGIQNGNAAQNAGALVSLKRKQRQIRTLPPVIHYMPTISQAKSSGCYPRPTPSRNFRFLNCKKGIYYKPSSRFLEKHRNCIKIMLESHFRRSKFLILQGSCTQDETDNKNIYNIHNRNGTTHDIVEVFNPIV